MNFLITAGGTEEKIDNVRSITNRGTGALGVKIAEKLHKSFEESNIYYLCGSRAFVPEFPNVKIIRIEDTKSLQTALTNLLFETKMDAVIHSMAVSDYTVHAVTTADTLAVKLAHRIACDYPNGLPNEDVLAEKLTAQIAQSSSSGYDYKISSELKNPLILLEQTPKIIGLIREFQPKTVLVGFKLLSNVSGNVLIDTAYKLMERNRCDLVLANDAEQIKNGSHTGYLINSDKSHTVFYNKDEIAFGIVQRLTEILLEKEYL